MTRPRRAAATASRKKTAVALQDSDTDTDAAAYTSPSPTPPPRPPRRTKRRRYNVPDSEEDESSERDDGNGQGGREDNDKNETIVRLSTDSYLNLLPRRHSPKKKTKIIVESDEDENDREQLPKHESGVVEIDTTCRARRVENKNVTTNSAQRGDIATIGNNSNTKILPRPRRRLSTKTNREPTLPSHIEHVAKQEYEEATSHNSNDEDEDEPLVLNRPSSKLTLRKSPRSSRLLFRDEDDDETDNSTIGPSTTPTKVNKASASTILDQDHSSEDDVAVSPSHRRSLRKDGHLLFPDSNDDEPTLLAVDHIATTDGRSHLASKKADQQCPHQSAEQSDDDDTPVTPNNRRRSLQKRQLRLASDTEEDDLTPPLCPPPAEEILEDDDGRNSVPRAEEMTDEDERNELQKDLEDLSQSAVFEERTRPRNRQSAFSKTLSDLKKRRLSNLSNEDTSKKRDVQKHDDNDQGYSYEGDEEGEEDEEDAQVEDSEDDFVESSFIGMRTNNRNQIDDEGLDASQLTDVADSQDIHDFIEEDESEEAVQELRRLSREQMPDEFQITNRQELDVDFRVYCQYLLHLIFDRDFDSKIQDVSYFQSSIKHVVRTLKTYRDSLSNSQVWEKRFRRDMQKYPQYRTDYGGARSKNCEACGIANHPSSVRVTLTGTFDDWSDFEPEFSDKEDDDEQVQNGVYYLGRDCHRRSNNYHAFHHWKFNILQRMTAKINAYLSRPLATMSQDELDAVDTNNLMEKLDTSGYIDRLWNELKTLMDTARSFSHATA